MMDAMCKESGSCLRHGIQRTECLTQCIWSQKVAGGRGNRGKYGGRIVCSGLLKEGECSACVRGCVRACVRRGGQMAILVSLLYGGGGEVWEPV